MKKIIFMGILGLFTLGSCNSKSGGNHEGHDHGTDSTRTMTTKGTTMNTKAKTMKDMITKVTDTPGAVNRLPVTVTKSFCRKPKRRQPE